MPAAAEPTVLDRSRLRGELTQWVIRWLLFFLICTGLGYAGVERYQPRNAPGLTDTALYYRLVAGEEVQGRDMRFRMLVPYVARLCYRLSSAFLEKERSVWLALLLANAIFCATTACLLVSVATRVTGNLAVALLAACLYLLNFAIANLQLSGMIDTGEACFMMALTWSLLSNRWWCLPVWGLFGALAKETFVPLAGVFSFAWWLTSQRRISDRGMRLFWVTALVVVGAATIIVSQILLTASIAISRTPTGTGGITVVAGGVSAGLELTGIASSGYLARLYSALFSRTFWYVFVWLLPLGALGVKRLPRAWLIAAVAGAGLALGLGLYRHIDGNVARPIFDVMGPLLSLAAAIWLTRTPATASPGPGSGR